MKYVLIILLFLLVILIILPMKLNIEFIYCNNYSKLDISTSYLFGLFKPEINPFNKKNTNIGHRNKLLKLKDKKVLSYIWNKLVFKELVWNTKIGLSDAALVSIVYGVMWNFKSILLNLVLRNKEIKKINIDILPIFNEDKLDIEFNCIFEIKIAHIIIIWLWLLKTHKGGDEVDRASNRRLNENYNE